jgi:hypothetical protein
MDEVNSCPECSGELSIAPRYLKVLTVLRELSGEIVVTL